MSITQFAEYSLDDLAAKWHGVDQDIDELERHHQQNPTKDPYTNYVRREDCAMLIRIRDAVKEAIASRMTRSAFPQIAAEQYLKLWQPARYHQYK